MTDLGSSRPDYDTSRVAYGNQPDPSGWTGWVVFASFMMFLVGSFQAVQGLVAIFDDGFYAVRPTGLSALANMAFIAANPFWSTLVITVDVLVIYALIVHGRELRDTAS
jgi:hypothetical protein